MTGPAQPYVPLWCKSNYSFLEGASHPEELVDACRQKDIPALALTDRHGVYGMVRAHVRARQQGIHLIAGSQISLREGVEILLLVRDGEGYRNLCRLLTDGHLGSSKGKCRLDGQAVCGYSRGLIALWIGPSDPKASPEATSEPLLERFKATFEDRLYLLLARHRQAEEASREIQLRKLAGRFSLPTVAAVEVLYHSPERRRLQDVLTCIREGATLTTAGRLTRPNDQHALKSPEELARPLQRRSGIGPADPRGCRPLFLFAAGTALPLSPGASAGRKDLQPAPARPDLRGSRPPPGQKVPRPDPAIAEGARSHPGAGVRRLLPDHCTRSWSTAAVRTSSARGEGRPPTRRSALPWGSPAWTRPRWTCSSSVFSPGREPSLRISTWTSSTTAGKR